MEKSFFLTKRQRYEDLKSQLDTDYNSFRPQYMELNDYFLPTRGRFNLSMDSNRGDKRNNKIIDPTGYMAGRTLSSGMQAGVTSPARPWKRLTTPDPDLAEFGPVREWLDLVDQRMNTFFLRSNLYSVLPVAYGDLGVFGTAAVFMDKDAKNVANYMSLPLGSYRIARNYRGQVNVFYREYRMTVRQVISHFGRKDMESGQPDWSAFSTTVRNLYNRGQYEEWVNIAWVIEPNEYFDPRMLHSKFKQFSSCWYEKDSMEMNGSEHKFLRESGYDYFPILVPRWQVTGQDVYGTDCPGMISLGDNKQLQHGEKRGAQAIDKMINPPMNASGSLKKSGKSIVSGDVTYLEDPNDKFTPSHEVRIDINHLTGKQEEIRGRINKAFYVDVFLPVLNDKRDQRASAAEIHQIGEERLLEVGPVLERLNVDLLDPLVDNKFLLMNEAGYIPEAPEELRGSPLKVQYISIMAEAQKVIGVSGLERILDMTTRAMAVDATVVNKLDVHEWLDQAADALGVTPRVLRADDKVQEIMAAQAKSQAASQNVAQAGELAGAAQKLSQTDMGNDSMLSRLLEQAKAGQLAPQ